MTDGDAALPRRGPWLIAAALWLAVVLAVAAHQWHFWHHSPLDTDVLALLPENEQAPEVTLATRRLAERVSRQVVVMIGAPDWPAARQAAATWRASLRDDGLIANAALDAAALGHAIEFYRPWRDRLLTPAQRHMLAETPPAALLQTALSSLYQPAAGAKLSDWAADPLGLWTQWWAARAGDTRARPRDGELWLSAEGREWIVLPYDVAGAAFSVSGKRVHGDALQAAEDATRRVVPDVTVLRAGIPLHSEAAAAQASREISTIGLGSLAAVLLLVWLAFRSVRPIALVALSLLVGCAAALSATAWVFGQVHLITLVFGASLVGVAEDYGIHYYASRQGHPGIHPRSLMRQLMPGLGLALSTSVLAYLVLGLTPFPGLRQMALFSAVGLVAAFLTAVCWFPLLDGGAVRQSAFASRIKASLDRWPRLGAGRPAWAAYGLLALLCVGGFWQLRGNDDIRQLQGSPPLLLQSQRDVGRLLGVPSPAQFYLVQGRDADEVLTREEALKARLDALVVKGDLAGYRAVSDWVPSSTRQSSDARLSTGAETQVLAGVNAALGEALQRPAFAPEPLSLPQWLASPVSAAARDLWLGDVRGQQASVVMLRGLLDPGRLPRLAEQAEGLPGVRWVDKTAEVSFLLGRYRIAMTWALVVGHAAVLALLVWRFRRAAWRAWLPTLLASLATVALLSWLGQSFQLFTVLALVLLLGIGVDYSIFLMEHEGDRSAWLAVVLGAASTWLSFGLLGLSQTPALRSFGLTLLFGVLMVWILAPMFRLKAPPRPAGAAPD